MKTTFDPKIAKDDFPTAESPEFSNRFVQNYATMVSQLSQILNGQISLGDNMNGTILKLPLAHGIPYLVSRPLANKSNPLGVVALSCDTQAIPTLTISSTATVNGVVTSAGASSVWLTALYPVLGTVLTDWVAYTPTGAWTGANLTYAGFWRRVGDTLEVVIKMLFTGAPTGTTLTLVTIPAGLTIDTSKLFSNATLTVVVGTAQIKSAGSGFYNGFTYYRSAGSVQPTVQNSISTDTQINTTVPGTWASGDQLQMQFKVPIVGWSSAPSTTANVTVFMVGA